MIEVVSKTDEAYNDLEEFVNAPAYKFDYAELARTYNSRQADDILVFEYRGSMISNFTKMLSRRGLERGEDYEVKPTQAGLEKGIFRVVLKKLSESTMTE